MKRKIIPILMILIITAGCGGKEEKDSFGFPFIPPQTTYSGVSGSVVLVFDRKIDRVWAENLPAWSEFTKAGDRRAVLRYSPPITISGTFIFKLHAESDEERAVADFQLTVLKPSLRVDYPPVLSIPDNVVVREGERVEFYVTASDPEGGRVDVDVDAHSLEEAGKSYYFDGEKFTWQTDYNSAGEYSLLFTATDGLKEVTGCVVIDVLDYAPVPDLYSLAFTFTVHEGDRLTFRFSVENTSSTPRVYFLKDIEGMSVSSTSDKVVVQFTPGFGYAEGDTVVNYLIVENGGEKRYVKFTFNMIDEGNLVTDFLADDAFLTPLIGGEYSFLITVSSLGGRVDLLDLFSNESLLFSHTITPSTEIFSAGLISDTVRFLYGNSQVLHLSSWRFIAGDLTAFDGPFTDVVFYRWGAPADESVYNLWAGEGDEWLLFPDYTTDESVKILRKSGTGGGNIYKVFNDADWVASDPEDHSPAFYHGGHGVKMISAGNHLFLSSPLIYNWPTTYENVSEHLAIVGIEGEDFENLRVEYVLPVTLPAGFADPLTSFVMGDLGYGNGGEKMFILVDGTGSRGIVGVLHRHGVEWKQIINFPSRVVEIFPSGEECFYALYEIDFLQMYCDLHGVFRRAGNEIDTSTLTSGGLRILNMSPGEGEIFILLGRDKRFQLIKIPGALLQQEGRK